MKDAETWNLEADLGPAEEPVLIGLAEKVPRGVAIGTKALGHEILAAQELGAFCCLGVPIEHEEQRGGQETGVPLAAMTAGGAPLAPTPASRLSGEGRIHRARFRFSAQQAIGVNKGER